MGLSGNRAALLVAAWAAMAGSGGAAALEEDAFFELSLEEVLDMPLTTGTRFEGRSAAESLVPIRGISAAELRSGSSADLSELLRDRILSFDVLSVPIADGSSFVRPFYLRGLPPDSTLVLVNGKRRHRAALVHLDPGPIALGAQGPDIAQLPAIAFQRLELLRDGSSAQYGSDAVAGVLNFILREDSATELRLQYGFTDQSDGDQRRLSAYHGMPLGASGHLSLSAEYVDRDEISRGGQRSDAAWYASQGLPVANPAMIWGSPEFDSLRSVWNAAWSTAGGLELYGFGSFARSHHDGSFFYRNLERDFFVNAVDTAAGSVLPCPVVADDPFGLRRAESCRALAEADPDLFSFLSRFPAGFTPRFTADIDDLAQVLGARGGLGASGRFDLSASFGRNTIDYGIRRTINPSLGPDSPERFDPGELEQTERGINLDLSWALQRLKIALGGEWREESYRIRTGDPDSWRIGPYPALGIGSNGFPGFDPGQAGEFSRRNRSLYLDLEAPVGAAWLLSAAARYENYSDFGDTTQGKLAARYAFNEALSLRATLSTGFRAPTPGQSHTTNVRTEFDASGVRPIAVGLVPPDSAIASYFGGRSLEPEDALSRSLGLSWQSGSLRATLDLYRIDVTDRIALGSTIEITPELREELVAAGVARAGDFGEIQFFVNTFDTETRGIEARIEYEQQHTGASTLWRLGLGHIETRVVDVAGAGVISPEHRHNLEHLLPRERLLLEARHSRGDWRLELRLRGYGPWQYAEEGWNEHFDANVFVDVEVARRLSPDWSAALGASNLFDEFPGHSRMLAGAGNPYVQFNPQSIEGVQYYLRLECHL